MTNRFDEEKHVGTLSKSTGLAAILGVGISAVLAGTAGCESNPAMLGKSTAAEPKSKPVPAAGTATAVIPVEGMSCGACAARVKKALTGIDGVAAAEVDLAGRNVRVRYAPGKVAPERLVAEINGLGYRASLPPKSSVRKSDVAKGEASATVVKTAVIPVEGMSCSACAARVKKALTSVDGVAAAEVNLAERNVRVRYDAAKVAPRRLLAEINELGYRASLPPQPGAERTTSEPAGPGKADGSAPVKTTLIPVEGMACEFCVEALETRLRAVEGVEDVSVSLEGKRARVRHVEGKASLERLTREIEEQGYKPGKPVTEGNK